MSVLMKGMEMPENCDVCIFSAWSNLHQTASCQINEYKAGFDDYSEDYKKRRSSDCPLMEIPDTRQEIIRCNECEYGELDENEEWFCRSAGFQIGSKDGSGYCADGERKVR